MSKSNLSIDIEKNNNNNGMYFNKEKIDKENHRYPHSIVWTPIPLLT